MPLKNNKIYRWIIIPICVAFSFFGRFIPPISGLTSDAVGVICIFFSVLVLWLTIGIDWPSLLCIASLAFLDNIGFSKAFTLSFGNSTFIFLLFTFVCTYALSQTSLIKRIALSFVDLKLAKRSAFCFVCLFLTGVLVLGLFISPSVLFVIILPILNEILFLAGIEKGDKLGKIMMIGLGFTVSLSSGMTTIAHVFPILAMNAANLKDITPLEYMGFAIPTGLVIFILMLLVFYISIRKEKNRFSIVDVKSIKNELPNLNKKDIFTLVIFVIVILLWIIPSIFKGVSPSFYNTINKYGTAMPPLLGCLALCIIRVDNEPIIKIEKAFKEGVPWSSLIMCASTLLLGSAMTNSDIGLNTFIQNSLSHGLSSLSPFILLSIFTIWAALQTNVSSNMVTATLVASVAASVLIADSSSFAPIICIIGFMASLAFATPPSMPHIAIVAGSEYCSTKDVLFYGLIVMLISIVSAICVGYPLGLLILK